MLKYIARRLLVVVPTLFAVLLISFIISRNVPGDPVRQEMEGNFRAGNNMTTEEFTAEYSRISRSKGYDQPTFYLSLSSLAYPDTLHRILDLKERENLAEMIGTFGDWVAIERYFHTVEQGIAAIAKLPATGDEKQKILTAQRDLEELKTVASESEIVNRLTHLDLLCESVPMLRDSFGAEHLAVNAAFAAVQQKQGLWRLYVPSLHFHGLRNQFHTWFMGILRLDFGRSYNSPRRPVRDMIAEALPVTMFMGVLSYAVAYMIAIPLGVYAVRNRNMWQDRATTVFLFMLNSVPTFVMAMLAMTFFCNPDYYQIFPTSGILSDGAEQWPFWYRMSDYAYHLVLPTLIFAYHGIAFTSRQLRGGMLENVNLDYIRTARAKGLPERTVVWRHALRNSLLPMITQLAGFFPAIVSGALITEFIFSVPGMGLLTTEAIGSRDNPVIIGTLMIAAFATLFGTLVADILYALADPRISFETK